MARNNRNAQKPAAQTAAPEGQAQQQAPQTLQDEAAAALAALGAPQAPDTAPSTGPAPDAPQAGAGEGTTPPATPPAQEQAAPDAPRYIGAPKYMRDPANSQLSGARLLSHTVAYIMVRTGGKAGVAMPEWVRIVGSSALAYHKRKGNLAIGPTGAPVLTPEGAAHFSGRRGNEAALIETYRRMFETGELPEGMQGEANPPRKIG